MHKMCGQSSILFSNIRRIIMKKTFLSILAALICMTMVFSMTAFAAEAAPVSTVEEGVLNIATNAEFPPYEFKEGDGFAGIDIEIGRKMIPAFTSKPCPVI